MKFNLDSIHYEMKLCVEDSRGDYSYLRWYHIDLGSIAWIHYQILVYLNLTVALDAG